MKKFSATLTALLLVFCLLTGALAEESSEIRVLSSAEYVLMWKNDADRGMTYKVPTHWTESAVGERYKVFSEPTPAGVSGFRVCFVNKKTASDDRSATRMKKEFKMLMDEMESVYSDFAWDGEITRDLSIVKFQGYQSEYTYTDLNGTAIRGFAIMAKYDKRIYCMNFSGPDARYTDMRSIMLAMLESITRST